MYIWFWDDLISYEELFEPLHYFYCFYIARTIFQPTHFPISFPYTQIAWKTISKSFMCHYHSESCYIQSNLFLLFAAFDVTWGFFSPIDTTPFFPGCAIHEEDERISYSQKMVACRNWNDCQTLSIGEKPEESHPCDRMMMMTSRLPQQDSGCHNANLPEDSLPYCIIWVRSNND